MLALHQLHRVLPGRENDFESLYREQWLPAIATLEGCRLAWFATPTPIARFGDEAATIITMRDPAAADALFNALRTGHTLRPGRRDPCAADERRDEAHAPPRLRPVDKSRARGSAGGATG